MYELIEMIVYASIYVVGDQVHFDDVAYIQCKDVEDAKTICDSHRALLINKIIDGKFAD